ncbi:MAG: hypothetical protein RLY29_276, partial [Actinomycetota bacterium]
AWFNVDGLEMTTHTWQDGSLRHLAFFIEATSNQGIFVILNGDQLEREFTLPNRTWGDSFRTVFDSAVSSSELNPALKEPSDRISVTPHSAQIWLVNRSKN